MRQLAVLGGRPVAEREIPINQPTLPTIDQVKASFGEVLRSAQVTNNRFVHELEERAQEYCGINHAIAVSSCTSGLMLAIQALQLRRKRVVLPSFTFPVTAHVVGWNHHQPVFADCDEGTFNLTEESVTEAMDERTGALLAVPIFGNPVPGSALCGLARRRRIPIIYDAAHALGALSQGKPVSTFADFAVFSMAPTKLVAAGEGGIVTTDDDELARLIRIGRNYGNPGNYDCEFAGLNARMSEFHAVLALFGLERLDDAIRQRTKLVAKYRELLASVPGVRFQEIRQGDRSTFNYFAILVDPEPFGLTTPELLEALQAENIGSRRYFYPPLHRQRIYAEAAAVNGNLAITDRVADRVLCLPLFTHLPMRDLEKVAETVAEIQSQAPAVRRALARPLTQTAGGSR